MSRTMLFLSQLIWMIKKELLSTLKDPKIRIILVLPILVQSFLFGYVATLNLERISYVIVDESHSYASSELISRFDSTHTFKRAATLSNTYQIAPYIESGDALLALHIPNDFGRLISHGERAQLQVIIDGRNATTAGVALGYVSRIVTEFNESMSGSQPSITLDTRAWYNPNLITRWSFLPGLLGLLSLVQVMLLSGLSVAREREQGTFDQLLVTPLSPTQILIGKAVVPICIGLVQALGVFAVSTLWFDIKFVGSFALLFTILLVFNLSATGIGLCISSISNSMQQVMVYCLVILLPMVLLSGLTTPIHNMPDVLQVLTYANPLRFALDGVRRVYLEGATYSQIAHNFIPMIIVAVISLPIAGGLFRNKAI